MDSSPTRSSTERVFFSRAILKTPEDTLRDISL